MIIPQAKRAINPILCALSRSRHCPRAANRQRFSLGFKSQFVEYQSVSVIGGCCRTSALEVKATLFRQFKQGRMGGGAWYCAMVGLILDFPNVYYRKSAE
jgi:hypothetical protein